MFGILLVTHDHLGEQLVEATTKIVSHELESINTVSIGWEQDLETAREAIVEKLESMQDNDEGIVIATDMFGGTPTNVALTFMEDNDLEVLTGINLPILIKLVGLQKNEVPRAKAVRIARDRGRQSIMIASEVLVGKEEESEENES